MTYALVHVAIGAGLLAASAKGQMVRPDLSELSREERAMVESACSLERAVGGPASYYRCLGGQLEAAQKSAGRPDLSALSGRERSMVESACGLDREAAGPASYYECLANQLAEMGLRPSYRARGNATPGVPAPEPEPPVPEAPPAATATPAPQTPVTSAAPDVVAPAPSEDNTFGWIFKIGLFVVFSLLTARAARSPQPQTGPTTKPPAAPQAQGDDPYAVLGLQPGATNDQIRSAYRSLVAKCHPDKVAISASSFRNWRKPRRWT